MKKFNRALFLASSFCLSSMGSSDSICLSEQDGGMVLPKQNSVELIQSDAGLEILAQQPGKNEPVYLSLDVTDAGFIDGKAPIQEFSFEYLDVGDEEVTFDIDSLNPLYGGSKDLGNWRHTGGFQLMNSGTWKKKTIVLQDARFSNRLNGADIRFRMVNYPDLKIRNVSLKKLEAMPALPEATVKQGTVPNILLIVFDDLNDYVGSFGDPNAKTPNLDSFAAGAMRFDRAYCQYPVCGPSRASFLTGMYPESSGVLDNNNHFRVKRPEAVDMLEYFKQQGYWTASAGKIYHSFQNVAENGVSTYFSDWLRNAEDPYLTKLNAQFAAEVGPIEKNREAYQAFLKGKDLSAERIVQAIATDLSDEDHDDGRVATRITSYLKERSFGDRPFFLACGFNKPHIPWFAPKKYYDLYPLDELKFEDVPLDDWKDKPKAAIYDRTEGYGAKFGDNNRAVRARNLQGYLACISFADAQFGRVLQTLEESGLADNTIVVMYSDHGYHLGEHFLFGKVTLFAESTRVPFLMRVPGKTVPGSRTQNFTELIDVYPTLTELCGLKTPPHVEGKSLVPVLENAEVEIRDSAYTVVSRTGLLGKGLRYQNWRYSEWGGSDQAELYNLDEDPNEYHNLANNPEYSGIIKTMRSKMEERTSSGK
ncbi:MAG: sulfatase [Kiritimatiellaceae bacterium]|nr:sulfatase [Kiritimatiellaceae bacterium]